MGKVGHSYYCNLTYQDHKFHKRGITKAMLLCQV